MYNHSQTPYFFPVMLSVEYILIRALEYSMTSSKPLVNKGNAARISVTDTYHAVADPETRSNNEIGGIAIKSGKLKIARLEGDKSLATSSKCYALSRNLISTLSMPGVCRKVQFVTNE